MNIDIIDLSSDEDDFKEKSRKSNINTKGRIASGLNINGSGLVKQEIVAPPTSTAKYDHAIPSTSKANQNDPVPSTSKANHDNPVPSTSRAEHDHAVPSTSRAGMTNGMHNGHLEIEENIDLSSTLETSKALKAMLDECKAIEDTKVMKEIIDKIWKKYSRCNPAFRESQELLNIIRENHSAVVDNPTLKCIYIKRVKEEMEFHCTTKRSRSHDNSSSSSKPKRLREFSPQPSTSNVSEESNDKAVPTRENQELSDEQREKRERHLKILWKSYIKCQEKIQKLEQTEVDWDSDKEGESQYIMEDKYKRRMLAIHKKIRQLSSEDIGKIKTRKKIHYSGSQCNALNKKVEEYINKCKKLPDFLDIKKVVTQGKEENRLALSNDEVDKLARAAFERIGRQWQRHREQELRDNLSCLLPAEDCIDPAENDPELERKLRENQEQYKHREQEVMAMFTKQAEDKDLKREEFQSGDEEEKDPEEEVESEEEEVTEINPEEMSDHSDSEKEEEKPPEEKQDIEAERPASPAGYVSTPGNTPDDDYQIDVAVNDEDSSTQPYIETVNSQSSSHSGIKLLDAFSIAETPEKLPEGCGLILKEINESLLMQAIKINESKATFTGAFSNTENNNTIKPVAQVMEKISTDKDRTIVVSTITPIKSNLPSLSVSPKISLNIVPVLKSQRARKSFPNSSPLVIKKEETLQTPEITSSSQDNKVDHKDDDDDCIVLSD